MRRWFVVVLHRFQTITRILQHSNHISDAGALALGEALKFNSCLHHLSLVSDLLFQQCSVFRVSVTLFSRFVAGVFRMTLVSQQCNKVSDTGAYGLCEGLKVNRSLQKLYLVRISSNFLCLVCSVYVAIL